MPIASLSQTIVIFISILVHCHCQGLFSQPEITVSENTVTLKDRPKISILADQKTFVVVWHSRNQDGDGFGIFGRAFNQIGTPLTGEFQVNTYNVSDQKNPDICARPDGSYTIVWESLGQQAGTDGVYAQIYNSGHSILVPEFAVGGSTTNQANPSVGCFSDNRFVIAYDSDGQEDQRGVFVRLFSPAASQIGSEIHVNTYTSLMQTHPAVAVKANDNYFIAWQSEGIHGAGYEIYIKRYINGSTVSSGEFHANTGSHSEYVGDQLKARIAELATGDIAIAWEDQDGMDGNGKGIFYRTLYPSGASIDPISSAASDRANDQENPAIMVSNDGWFGILWQSNLGGGYYSIMLQRFDNDGSEKGPETLVNNLLYQNSRTPDGAVFESQRTWMVWASQGSKIVGKVYNFTQLQLECITDSDCLDPSLPKCDPIGFCSQCERDEDCSSSNQICSNTVWECKPCLGGLEHESNGECLHCDGSCQTCDGPYPTNCLSCSNGYYFYHETSECLPSCPEPEYISYIDDGVEICESANQTIVDPDNPTITDCDQNQFYNLSFTGNCIDSCDYPYIQDQSSTNNSVRCAHPCPSSQKPYFENSTNTCESECPNKLIVEINSVLVCTSSQSQTNEQSIKSQATAASSSQGLANSAGTLSAMSSSRGPNSLALIIISKFLLYLRHVNINYPQNLQTFYQNYDDELLGFGIPSPDGIEGNDTVPNIFAKYKITSGFLYNYWGSGMTLVVILGLALLLTLLGKIIKNSKKQQIRDLLKELRIVIRWNLFLMIFCSNLDEIILYGYLEFQSEGQNTQQNIRLLGLLFGAIMLIVLAFIIGQFIFIIIQYQRFKKKALKCPNIKSQPLENFIERWQCHKVIFQPFKDHSIWLQGYMLIFLGRVLIFTFIICFGSESPLLQMILILILNVGMVLFAILKRPCKEWVNNLELILYELILMVANTSALILSIMGLENTSMRENIGQTIIVCFFLFAIVSLVFLVAHFVSAIFVLIKQIKQKKSLGEKMGCLEILTIPFESGGMSLGESSVRRLERLIRKMRGEPQDQQLSSRDNLIFKNHMKKTAKVTPLTASETNLTPRNPFKHSKFLVSTSQNLEPDSPSLELESPTQSLKMSTFGGQNTVKSRTILDNQERLGSKRRSINLQDYDDQQPSISSIQLLGSRNSYHFDRKSTSRKGSNL